MEASSEILITKWKTIKPRADIARGASCYHLKKGIKISKVFDANNKFVYYYCDIIDTEETTDGYVFHDLLLDVIIYPDGFVKVADIGEIADALEEGLVTVEAAKKSLRAIDYLLNEIYEKRFGALSAAVDMYD